MKRVALVLVALAVIVAASVLRKPKTATHSVPTTVPAAAKDVSGIATDVLTHKEALFAPCKARMDAASRIHYRGDTPTMEWAEAQVAQKDCFADYNALMTTAEQVSRVEDTGFAQHDMGIATQLDADRENLAAQLEAFKAKYREAK